MQPPLSPPNISKTSYDFSSLGLPVTDADRMVYKEADGANNPRRAFLVTMLIFTVVMGVFAFSFFSMILSSLGFDGRYIKFVVVLIWLGLVALSMVGVYWVRRRRLDNLVALNRLAVANGMQFIHDRKDPTYSGMIFDEGHSRMINEALILPDGTEIGNYTYVTGSGKNRSTHSYAFARLPLQRALPHMVLDAKRNNLFGKFSNLPDTFNAQQTLSLEGDFDKHFTLYAPREYERDALYVFTPDVMASLIDTGSGYDMETIDKELYIYRGSHINFMDGAELTTMCTIIDTIGTELRLQTTRYADERVGDTSRNTIAPQGSRLKHGVNWLIVGIVTAIVIYQLVESFFVLKMPPLLMLAIPYVMLMGFILIVVFSKLRRS